MEFVEKSHPPYKQHQLMKTSLIYFAAFALGGMFLTGCSHRSTKDQQTSSTKLPVEEQYIDSMNLEQTPIIDNTQNLGLQETQPPIYEEKNRNRLPTKAIEDYSGTPTQAGEKSIRISSSDASIGTEGYETYYHPVNPVVPYEPVVQIPDNSNESYGAFLEQPWQSVVKEALSTFSIDVDNASYTNIRRMLQSGSLPPKDAVRLEEMINFFTYSYPQPHGEHPFSFTTELGNCPWNSQHKIIRIGMQGKSIPTNQLPSMNLVFLLDVSGSMNSHNKLPLLKKSLLNLCRYLRPQDKISIVVYAGAEGMVLPPTPGNDATKISQAFEQLQAGGSTAGGAGIELAYKIAVENFIPNGLNRILLATDGDFNVGVSSPDALKTLIEEKRKSNIYLTVLGFGMGNLKDANMEVLADHGNGNYYYIDTYEEACRVLGERLDATLCAIAGDVKFQLEFNPGKVKYYRLLGYDNRRMAKEDFHNDLKDAGELGAGHTVTALYEIIPTSSKEEPLGYVDPLKYQSAPEKIIPYNNSPEWLTLKLRYKKPGENVSKLLTQGVVFSGSDHPLSEDLKFASAVAGFGLILKDSEFKGNLSYSLVKSLASGGLSKDPGGYRAEFLRLVSIAESLDPKPQAQK